MKYLFIIQQFAEGAAPAGTSTGAEGAVATAVSEAADGTVKAEGKGSGRKNKPDLSKVIYGRAPTAETTEVKSEEVSSEAVETESTRQTLAHGSVFGFIPYPQAYA